MSLSTFRCFCFHIRVHSGHRSSSLFIFVYSYPVPIKFSCLLLALIEFQAHYQVSLGSREHIVLIGLGLELVSRPGVKAGLASPGSQPERRWGKSSSPGRDGGTGWMEAGQLKQQTSTKTWNASPRNLDIICNRDFWTNKQYDQSHALTLILLQFNGSHVLDTWQGLNKYIVNEWIKK